MSAGNELTVEELLGSGESQTTASSDSPEFSEDVQSESSADPALPDQSTDPLATDDSVGATASPRVIHFVYDGFTVLGRVWESGEELEITQDIYDATVDITGHSILDYSEADQVVRYGQLMWREGEAPQPLYAAQLALHEQKLADQARRPPVVISQILPVTTGA